MKPDLAHIVPFASVQRNADLARLTTFRVGGPADWLVDIKSVDELKQIWAMARELQAPITVLGGGSNVLISDRGIRGIVVRLRLTGIANPSPTVVRAEAGVSINALARWTISRGLAGIEAWAGTPGTVGGAVYGNAHFGGRNIGDLVVRAKLVTREGHWHELAHAEMEFAYDASRLQRTGEILVWTDFAVSTGDPDALRRIARESLARRKETQPLDIPSAGCVFQNPTPEETPPELPASAGALVDLAGLKGRRLGGAAISPTHANFILNAGGATAQEIRALIDLAKEAVRDQFGVLLREEVVSLGEF